MSSAEPTTSSPSADPAADRDDRIEIVLPDGTALRVTMRCIESLKELIADQKR